MWLNLDSRFLYWRSKAKLPVNDTFLVRKSSFSHKKIYDADIKLLILLFGVVDRCPSLLSDSLHLTFLTVSPHISYWWSYLLQKSENLLILPIYYSKDNYIVTIVFSLDESFLVFDEISQKRIKLYHDSYHRYKYKNLKYLIKYF